MGYDPWRCAFHDGEAHPALHGLSLLHHQLSHAAGYSHAHRIMVWVNGQFLHIKDAYDQNLITKNMVETIANIHNGTKGKPIKVS